jgi:hypothetical protein
MRVWREPTKADYKAIPFKHTNFDLVLAQIALATNQVQIENLRRKMMKIQYFHIEGMDLVGKTSATNALSITLGDNCKTRRSTLQGKSQFHKIVETSNLSKVDVSDKITCYFQS